MKGQRRRQQKPDPMCRQRKVSGKKARVLKEEQVSKRRNSRFWGHQGNRGDADQQKKGAQVDVRPDIKRVNPTFVGGGKTSPKKKVVGMI